MKRASLFYVSLCVLVACATDSGYDPLSDYEVVDATTILVAPAVAIERVAIDNRAAVQHGKYLVELLGCGACHTDGALIGEPNSRHALAGSNVGIAFTNPLQNSRPGIVFPPNLTPDDDTGIGRWTNKQIAAAIRVGQGRHGERRILVMPWQAYTSISESDVQAIVGYLRSIDPISHAIPADVPVGSRTSEMYVHFGVYRARQ